MRCFANRCSRLDNLVLLGVFFGSCLVGCGRFDTSGILIDETPDASTPADAANNPDTAVADANVIVDATPIPDATPPIDAPCWSWAPMHFDPCDIPPPTGDLVIDNLHVYDTDARMFTTGSSANPPAQDITQFDGTDAVLISITSLTITSTGRLRVVGSRPLIVASAGDIDLAGELDVSSKRADTAGAGANHANCNAPMIGETDSAGAGGSGGGGFQGVGGNGGPGDASDSPSAGGDGGSAVGMVPTTVRGGCPGATGGDSGNGPPSPGGSGGGAVQLTAQISITAIGATLHAGGAGGPGAGFLRNGGAGGGSGGYIGLDAPNVTLDRTIVAANGGGGGEGGGNDAGNPGADGQPSNVEAGGGAGAQKRGGDGAAGSARIELNGQTATDHRIGGGGGGGGGAGYIVIRADNFFSNSVTMSPPPSQ